MKSLLLIALLLTACTKPVEQKPTAPVIVPAQAPTAIALLSSITDDTMFSSCAKYQWKDRGLAPVAFINGMALAYAREVCFPNKVVSSALGDPKKDALAWYGLPASALNVYALMIGSGMRESSGKYCEGRDMSATNTSATSAEAGMFQTSYDSHVASPELDVIFNDYKTNTHNCLNEFKVGARCSKANLDNYGSGDGLKFQQMAKDCPSFTVAYAAVTFRTLKSHYGPLIKKAAEYRMECVDMLKGVEAKIKATPSLCDQLK